jgi:hypothetical protein
LSAQNETVKSFYKGKKLKTFAIDSTFVSTIIAKCMGQMDFRADKIDRQANFRCTKTKYT